MTPDDKTVRALRETLRLAEDGMRLAARGHDWYVGDPDNVPGLAAESLIIKLGENVGRVSATFKDAHPDIPWRVIKEMRNRLTHYYEATDHEIVWDTIHSNFPEIAEMMRGVLGD